jgi:hypothetical protein
MKAPTPPDPYATAAAQTQSNHDTASYNAALNRVSQYTPYGNNVYSQTGTDTSGAPTYRSDITLAPQAQQQLDNQLKQNNQLSQLGFTLGNQVGEAINKPYSDGATSRDAAQNAYYARETGFLDPQFKNQGNDLDARLANQGVVQGSQAYGRAQDEFGRQKAFAYGQAQQQAIGQGDNAQATALQNQSALKNASLNQLNALRSGTQIQNPSFTNAPTSNAAGTDISGLIERNYGQQSANANNFNSGLFSLAGSAAMAASDRRLKHNVVKIGRHRIGVPRYAYSYLGSARRYIGVMAQDVAKVMPAAVVTMPSGFLSVNYGMIG